MSHCTRHCMTKCSRNCSPHCTRKRSRHCSAQCSTQFTGHCRLQCILHCSGKGSRVGGLGVIPPMAGLWSQLERLPHIVWRQSSADVRSPDQNRRFLRHPRSGGDRASHAFHVQGSWVGIPPLQISGQIPGETRGRTRGQTPDLSAEPAPGISSDLPHGRLSGLPSGQPGVFFPGLPSDLTSDHPLLQLSGQPSKLNPGLTRGLSPGLSRGLLSRSAGIDALSLTPCPAEPPASQLNNAEPGQRRTHSSRLPASPQAAFRDAKLRPIRSESPFC
jgi:hypothetical protein